MDERSAKVFHSLSLLCSRQECCSSDIFRKALKRLEGDEDAAREVLDKLKEEKYVDDRRYAEAYAREKSQISGWGPVKIRYALSGKGISRDISDPALAEIDRPVADARLEKLIQAKWKTLEGDPQAKLKLIRFGLARGYEYSQIENLLRNLKLR